MVNEIRGDKERTSRQDGRRPSQTQEGRSQCVSLQGTLLITKGLKDASDEV